MWTCPRLPPTPITQQLKAQIHQYFWFPKRQSIKMALLRRKPFHTPFGAAWPHRSLSAGLLRSTLTITQGEMEEKRIWFEIAGLKAKIVISPTWVELSLSVVSAIVIWITSLLHGNATVPSKIAIFEKFTRMTAREYRSKSVPAWSRGRQ